MSPSTFPDRPAARCWAEIDLSALRSNVRFCRDLAGPGCGLMAIVKADAYGHGLPETVRALSQDGTKWFGVANLKEARQIREVLGDRGASILVLSPATPDEIPSVVAGGFSGSVSSVGEVNEYASAARELGREARLHAVADTGMGRMGSLADDFAALVKHVLDTSGCRLEGVETHMPSADEEPDFTVEQIAAFRTLLESVELPPGCLVHLGNSAGLLGFQDQCAFASLARPGLALYGISPLAGVGRDLQPVLTLKTRVTLVRQVPEGTTISYGRTFVAGHPMRVATLGVGYGDGYPRHLSGREADVLVAGQRCRLLGRVTMDQIVVDVSHLPDPVARGDEVVLIGRQRDSLITAGEIAEKAGTIPWEILTGITSRVERTYFGAGTYTRSTMDPKSASKRRL
ncbi:MAG: alanine racemase [Verrucomicrobiales bacterium]